MYKSSLILQNGNWNNKESENRGTKNCIREAVGFAWLEFEAVGLEVIFFRTPCKKVPSVNPAPYSLS